MIVYADLEIMESSRGMRRPDSRKTSLPVHAGYVETPHSGPRSPESSRYERGGLLPDDFSQVGASSVIFKTPTPNIICYWGCLLPSIIFPLFLFFIYKRWTESAHTDFLFISHREII